MGTTDIISIIQKASGLSPSASTIQRAVRDRMKQCGIDSVTSYRERVTDPIELTALLELLVVHETWLFRDPEAFVAATEFVRTRLASTDRPLRILSIPCSSGEEPYSIAMALIDAGVETSQVLIEGIDISADILDVARRGIYGRNAFRSSDLSFRDRHFTPVEREYQLDSRVRSMVRFSQGNLLEMNTDTMNGAFDVLFCRNLLIYFDESTQQVAIRKLRLMLHDGGLLLAGYAEIPVFFQQGFAVCGLRKAFALRKKNNTDNGAATSLTALAPTPPPIATVPASNRPTTAFASRPETLHQKATFPKPEHAVRSSAAPTDVATAHSTRGASLAEAIALADQGAFKEATDALNAFIKNVPDCAEAYFLLGLTSERLGNRVAAETSLRNAIYLDPDHYDALCHLALLARQSGDMARAASLKERAARVFRRRSSLPNGSRP